MRTLRIPLVLYLMSTDEVGHEIYEFSPSQECQGFKGFVGLLDAIDGVKLRIYEFGY